MATRLAMLARAPAGIASDDIASDDLAGPIPGPPHGLAAELQVGIIEPKPRGLLHAARWTLA
jgi:hypothetical protein